MGMEFDNLKNNEDMVIYNNTTGQVKSFYDLKSFVSSCKYVGIMPDKIKDYFKKEELIEFLIQNNYEFSERELKKIEGMWD